MLKEFQKFIMTKEDTNILYLYSKYIADILKSLFLKLSNDKFIFIDEIKDINIEIPKINNKNEFIYLLNKHNFLINKFVMEVYKKVFNLGISSSYTINESEIVFSIISRYEINDFSSSYNLEKRRDYFEEIMCE